MYNVHTYLHENQFKENKTKNPIPLTIRIYKNSASFFRHFKIYNKVRTLKYKIVINCKYTLKFMLSSY